ncbi:hypothetical protein ACWCQN_29555 [Streptomyces sp. NPDC001984]
MRVDVVAEDRSARLGDALPVLRPESPRILPELVAQNPPPVLM